MGELLDISVKQVVDDFVAAPIQQEEIAPGEFFPILPDSFAKQLVDRYSEAGRISLLIEALTDTSGIDLDPLQAGDLLTGPDCIARICTVVLTAKASEVEGVEDRISEQWAACFEAHPEELS